MKFNWGHGITIFFILFVGTLIFVVISSRKVDRSLVFDNYYEKDIQYQSHINKVKNTTALTKGLEIDKKNGAIIFQFPDLPSINGTIAFYRASDKSKDFTKRIILNSKSVMKIDVRSLLKGVWTVKVEWSSNGVPYYTEKHLYF